MTPEQFKKEMERIIAEHGMDWESSHAEADELMCRVLVEHGYASGVAVFEKMGKWYA